MRTKPVRENYTGVCRFCGVIFKSIRSDALHCCDNHRTAYGQPGRPLQINLYVEGEDGTLINGHHMLNRAYNDRPAQNRDAWSSGYLESCLKRRFNYTGPLPQGAEFLVVGGYLMKRSWKGPIMSDWFLVKPIALLTPAERASGIFVSAAERSASKALEQGPQVQPSTGPLCDEEVYADWPVPSVKLPTT